MTTTAQALSDALRVVERVLQSTKGGALADDVRRHLEPAIASMRMHEDEDKKRRQDEMRKRRQDKARRQRPAPPSTPWLTPPSGSRLQLYCGNLDCVSRTFDPPTLFAVDLGTLADGETWLCPACQRAREAAK